MVLCFSPVGATLRVRSRKFPAITNCTSIDWFHEWPEEALISVSRRFLSDNELLSVSNWDIILMLYVGDLERSIQYRKSSMKSNDNQCYCY